MINCSLEGNEDMKAKDYWRKFEEFEKSLPRFFGKGEWDEIVEERLHLAQPPCFSLHPEGFKMEYWLVGTPAYPSNPEEAETEKMILTKEYMAGLRDWLNEVFPKE